MVGVFSTVALCAWPHSFAWLPRKIEFENSCMHACMLARTGTYDGAVSFGHCSVRQLTCAQVEAMSPSERVSSIFIKVKGGRSQREQLILKLGAGRLCIRNDCSSIIFATRTTYPCYEYETCPQCLGYNQNSPSRRRTTAAAAEKPKGLAGDLTKYRHDHKKTMQAVEEIYDELVYTVARCKPRSVLVFLVHSFTGLDIDRPDPPHSTRTWVSVSRM